MIVSLSGFTLNVVHTIKTFSLQFILISVIILILYNNLHGAISNPSFRKHVGTDLD